MLLLHNTFHKGSVRYTHWGSFPLKVLMNTFISTYSINTQLSSLFKDLKSKDFSTDMYMAQFSIFKDSWYHPSVRFDSCQPKHHITKLVGL